MDVLTPKQALSAAALAIPEIVGMVLENFTGDKRALLSTSLVNHVWFVEGTNVLWKTAPISALFHISSRRRQEYASKIVGLSLDTEYFDRSNQEELEYLRDVAKYLVGDEKKTAYERLQALQFDAHTLKTETEVLVFPQLKTLDDGKTFKSVDNWPLHLLQPDLKHLSIMTGDPGSEILDEIERQCPKLRSISLHLDFRDVSPRRLSRFLLKCDKLETVKLDYCVRYAFNIETLSVLASCEALRYLTIPDVYISQSMIPDSSSPSTSGSTFRNLQHLDVGIETQALWPLIPILQSNSITSLQLALRGRDVNVFRALSSLGSLQGLELIFQRKINGSVQPQNFNDLGSLVGLRTLTLHTFWCSGQSPFQTIGCLTNLERLEVSFTAMSTKLSPEDLVQIGKLINLRDLALEIHTPNKDTFLEHATKNDMNEFFSSLNCLERVRLGSRFYNRNLPGAAITTLGKSNPYLRTCEVSGNFDLGAWEAIQKPIFPNLELLLIQDSENPFLGSSPAHIRFMIMRYNRVIMRHCPKLRYPMITLVVPAWGEWYEHRLGSS